MMRMLRLLYLRVLCFSLFKVVLAEVVFLIFLVWSGFTVVLLWFCRVGFCASISGLLV